MAITITVEDGSIVADANSYIDQTYFRAFTVERGVDHSATADDVIAAALIEAMDLLDSYAERFAGARYDESTPQELEWPRSGYYRSGAAIDYTAIPNAVKKCQAQLAFDHINGIDLQPNQSIAEKGAVLSENIAGAVSLTYAEAKPRTGIEAFSKAINFLKPVLKSGGTGSTPVTRV